MKINPLFISMAFLALVSCKDYAKNNSIVSDTTTMSKTLESNSKFIFQKIIGQPRYSIIQSPITAKGTYKLDSYTGNVYQLVLDSSKNETWQLITKIKHSLSDTQNENTNNYILFVSTIAMRFTYLMNINTGATWQLEEDPTTKDLFFSPIE